MKENKGEVKIIFPEDCGVTFKKHIRVDEGNAVGCVDVVTLNEKTAILSWMEGSTIKAVKVNTDGTKAHPVVVTESSDSRSGGFPKMTKAGN